VPRSEEEGPVSYLMIVVVVLALVGAAVWLRSAMRTPRPAEDRQPKVTSTEVRPPRHPDEPVPGSDAARNDRP
jgi:hypothetical protein